MSLLVVMSFHGLQEPVVKAQNSGNLLCADTAQELNLISLHVNKLSQVSANVKTTDPKLKKLLNKHASVFTGLGKLKNQNVKLSIDESVLPKAQPQRRIPYHIRDKVTTALKDLENEDVIERVPDDVGTPWVSPILRCQRRTVEYEYVSICVKQMKPFDELDTQFQLLMISVLSSTEQHVFQNWIYHRRTINLNYILRVAISQLLVRMLVFIGTKDSIMVLMQVQRYSSHGGGVLG